MPKEALCTAPHKIEWREYEIPELLPDEVRIEAEFGAAKQGTELSGFKGITVSRGRYDSEFQLFEPEGETENSPRRIGNMVVGRVTEVGVEAARFQAGNRVLAYGGIKPVHTVSEARVWGLPEGVPWQSAVCLDPADFALGAVRDGNVRIGDAVAFFGMGAISLMGIQHARLAGAHPIIAVDPIDARRRVADKLGATHALDPANVDAGKEIKKICGNRGADVIIEYSGNRRALQDALRGVAFGGMVVCGAFPAPYDAGLDLGSEAHMNRPTIKFSRACSDPSRDHPRWNDSRIFETCHRLIVTGQITGVGIVSEPVPVDEILAAYMKMSEDPEYSIKLGYSF